MVINKETDVFVVKIRKTGHIITVIPCGDDNNRKIVGDQLSEKYGKSEHIYTCTVGSILDVV